MPGPGGGGNMSSPPSWARGTWYWNQGSDRRQMIIDRAGKVTLYQLGNTMYGTYYREVISIAEITLNISRNGNGIRLQNPNTGEISLWHH